MLPGALHWFIFGFCFFMLEWGPDIHIHDFAKNSNGWVLLDSHFCTLIHWLNLSLLKWVAGELDVDGLVSTFNPLGTHGSVGSELGQWASVAQKHYSLFILNLLCGISVSLHFSFLCNALFSLFSRKFSVAIKLAVSFLFPFFPALLSAATPLGSSSSHQK